MARQPRPLTLEQMQAMQRQSLDEHAAKLSELDSRLRLIEEAADVMGAKRLIAVPPSRRRIEVCTKRKQRRIRG